MCKQIEKSTCQSRRRLTNVPVVPASPLTAEVRWKYNFIMSERVSE